MNTDTKAKVWAEVKLAVEMVEYAQRHGYQALMAAYRIAMQSVILDGIDKATPREVALDEQELREEDWR